MTPLQKAILSEGLTLGGIGILFYSMANTSKTQVQNSVISGLGFSLLAISCFIDAGNPTGASEFVSAVLNKKIRVA
jgi:hypothetical protein